MSDLLVDIGCAAIGGAVALGLLLHLRKRQARGVERRSRPAALRDAELVLVEKTFRTTSPVPSGSCPWTTSQPLGASDAFAERSAPTGSASWWSAYWK